MDLLEARNEIGRLEAENANLQARVKEMADHPLVEIRPDGKVRGHNCAGCEGLERELGAALLQVRDLSVALERISNSCDGLAKDTADAALGYAEKPSCPHPHAEDFGPSGKAMLCPECGVVVQKRIEPIQMCRCSCHEEKSMCNKCGCQHGSPR